MYKYKYKFKSSSVNVYLYACTSLCCFAWASEAPTSITLFYSLKRNWITPNNTQFARPCFAWTSYAPTSITLFYAVQRHWTTANNTQFARPCFAWTSEAARSIRGLNPGAITNWSIKTRISTLHPYKGEHLRETRRGDKHYTTKSRT